MLAGQHAKWIGISATRPEVVQFAVGGTFGGFFCSKVWERMDKIWWINKAKANLICKGLSGGVFCVRKVVGDVAGKARWRTGMKRKSVNLQRLEYFFPGIMFFWMWREDAERASRDNTYIEADVPALLLIPTLRLVNGFLASMIDLSAAGILH